MLNTTTTARRLRTPCESGAATEQLRAHDVPFEECGSWCSPKEASAHCSWCKCRACSFCRPTDELTHVYASAGIGMAACTEGSPVEWPATVPGTPTAATLDQCKRACDQAQVPTACHSFRYSGSSRECRLTAADGEPRKFCKIGDLASYWRVELPAEQQPAAEAVASTDGGSSAGGNTAAAAAAAEPAGPPRRIVVQGRRLLDSRTDEEVVLHGVNVYIDYMRFDDLALLQKLLPGANVVRLVGVFWHDVERVEDCSCCTDDPTRGYFAPACLDAVRAAVRHIASSGLWVILTAKARFAAGEGWPRVPDVFHDERLAERYRAMWTHIATELANEPGLAGYEVLSEPRNKQVPPPHPPRDRRPEVGSGS